METSSITILGGDLRQCYAAEYLKAAGFPVMCYHTPDFPYSAGIQKADCLKRALAQSELILAPTPLTRDNDTLFQTALEEHPCSLEALWKELTPRHKFITSSLSEDHKKNLKNAGCQIMIFGNEAFFQTTNALLTAEGLLAEIIRCTPFSLSAADILLLGYGYCGTAIGRIFLPLCQNIYVIEQDTEKQIKAKQNGLIPVEKTDFAHVLPKCGIIINTVPGPILKIEQLSQMPVSCHIFDIASAPFGFPSETTKKCLMPYYRIGGIPGRFSPVTAGETIGRTIERMIQYAL